MLYLAGIGDLTSAGGRGLALRTEDPDGDDRRIGEGVTPPPRRAGRGGIVTTSAISSRWSSSVETAKSDCCESATAVGELPGSSAMVLSDDERSPVDGERDASMKCEMMRAAERMVELRETIKLCRSRIFPSTRWSE